MISAEIGPREDYTTLTIIIGKPARRNGRCPVTLEIPGWRVFPPGRLALRRDALEALRMDPEAYGKMLGKALFSGQVGAGYAETLAVCQGRGDGLRVRLLVEPEALQGLHWERIYHRQDGEWRPLGSAAAAPFSRLVASQQWERPLPATRRPLRVLAVIASPRGLDAAQLDPIGAEERARLKDVFARLPDLHVTYLESETAKPPTMDAMRAALMEEVDFIHFLCHGARTSAGSVLLLEAPDGTIDAVDTARLAAATKAVQKPPAFVFLTACESAARGRSDGFLPLGPALVEDGGVQAALAMTGTVGMETAAAFTGAFFTRLLHHGMVDLAVNEARAMVQDRWDWGAPVLFSRLPDNQLIDFPIGGAAEGFIGHAGMAFSAVDEAMEAARMEEHGEELVEGLQDLIHELSKSNAELVKAAGDFRRTGSDPASFQAAFEAYYYDFKEYYDQQLWLDAQTSCTRIRALRAKLLPRLAPILRQDLMDAIRAELDQLSGADNDLLRHFRSYLDGMNGEVEAIFQLLSEGNVTEAIERKRAFEAQISPGFQRSKALFERMTHSVHAVQAA